VLNWILIAAIMTGLVTLVALLVPPETWARGLAGYAGLRSVGRQVRLPALGRGLVPARRLRAFSGAGRASATSRSRTGPATRATAWARSPGSFPAAIGGEKVHLSHTGFKFATTPDAMQRWQGWWRLVRADQYVVFFVGAMLGMLLPGAALCHLCPARIRHPRDSASRPRWPTRSTTPRGPIFGGAIALMAMWVLFKTQLDLFEGLVRQLTDIVWTGSKQARNWRGGDVRLVYYGILIISVVWGVIALRMAQPIFLLQIAANMGGLTLAIAALHLLYINTKFLPPRLRPSMPRRIGLVLLSIFYVYSLCDG
jgi:hypothetical protein